MPANRFRTPKSARSAALVLFFALAPFCPLSAQSPSPVPAAVTEAFSEVRAQRTTVAGEYLLRIAEAAYGNKLLWPLVWVFNSASLPDPERVPLGSKLTVARLERELTDPLVVRALDEAYRLIWQQYAKVHAGDKDKSRWILGQAAEAGVDVTSPAWLAILGADEKAYVKTLKVIPLATAAPSPAVISESPTGAVPAAALPSAEASAAPSVPASTPAPAASPSVSLTTPVQQEKFLADVLAGTPLTGPEMESFAALLDTPGGASLLTRLEQAALKADVPPQVSYVLALHYGRKGMKAREYQALVQTRTQADRRPDIIFNLLLVNGRMALLKADRTIEEVLPAALTVLSEPAGATVTVAGEEWGVTPLTREGLRPGTYEVMLTKEGYQLSGQAVTLDLGERREVRGNLKHISSQLAEILVISDPPGAIVLMHSSIIGQTPVSITGVEPGTKEITLNLPGYELLERTLFIKPGEKVELNISLVPEVQLEKDEFVHYLMASAGYIPTLPISAPLGIVYGFMGQKPSMTWGLGGHFSLGFARDSGWVWKGNFDIFFGRMNQGFRLLLGIGAGFGTYAIPVEASMGIGLERLMVRYEPSFSLGSLANGGSGHLTHEFSIGWVF